ncbi:MAG: GyrI-like domain-containing protein [Clostridia bacterium]|nr:GyrI-like domain-containing protein [Clostridia bacterium]
MDFSSCIKESFTVIGLEGSTRDGGGFIQALWKEANARFAEVSALAARNEQGDMLGIWGAMSDFSRSFLPWEDGFTKGLYLAGIETSADAEAPTGWTRWTVPGFEYLTCRDEGPDTFAAGLEQLRDRRLPLAGAVHEFTCPEDGQRYLYFPIRRL